jgi:hypothetical protein
MSKFSVLGFLCICFNFNAGSNIRLSCTKAINLFRVEFILEWGTEGFEFKHLPLHEITEAECLKKIS